MVLIKFKFSLFFFFGLITGSDPFFQIIKLLAKVPDINPFVRTKLEERPLDLAEFPECHQLLEELEKQKKSLAADVTKGGRPINRQSHRGYVLADLSVFRLQGK